MTLICERCKNKANPHIMSMFNEDIICLKCKDKEIKHPLYKLALEAENKSLKRGETNFKGIGKPSDL